MTKDLYEHIYSINIKDQRGVICYYLLVAMIWAIWLERNKRIFNNQSSIVNNTWEDICNLTGSWSSNRNLFNNYSLSNIALNIIVFY